MSKLSQTELSAILEAASTGAIGFVFSPDFQKLLARAREQKRDERRRAIETQEAVQRDRDRERYKVRCPQCGSRLKLEVDHDY